eukprot:scaffold250052_cov30-Tisochrysis_lutea.AAC.3
MPPCANVQCVRSTSACVALDCEQPHHSVGRDGGLRHPACRVAFRVRGCSDVGSRLLLLGRSWQLDM